MGWKNYKLVTFGCSFTYGHGLSDCIAADGSNGPIASEQAWPSLLGKLTGMEVDNASKPGSGNLMITKAIVDYSKYTKDTVVVIMWSNNDRETIYDNEGKEKLHMLPGFLNDRMPKGFWKDKKVLITGNTGFKGSWCQSLLNFLGADTLGYSDRTLHHLQTLL